MEYQKQNENPFEVLVYEALKKKILSGEYLAGDKIPEEAVSEELGVSRSPLRSAIRRLISEDLVEYYPYRGAYVKKFTEKDIRECYEMRILLETYALEHISPDKLEMLRETLLQLVERCRAVAAHEEREKEDMLVHETIVKLCGNDTLLNSYRGLRAKISLFRDVSVSDTLVEEGYNRAHLSLLLAILKGDTEEALRVIREHLRESEERALANYPRCRKKS